MIERVRDTVIRMVRDMQPTREIVQATGWNEQAIADVRRHEYRQGRIATRYQPNIHTCRCMADAFLTRSPVGWNIECSSCMQSLLYPRRTPRGAETAWNAGRYNDPPSHLASER